MLKSIIESLAIIAISSEHSTLECVLEEACELLEPGYNLYSIGQED